MKDGYYAFYVNRSSEIIDISYSPEKGGTYDTGSIVKDEPITLYNYGDMKRDFTYVEDIVQGVQIVLESDIPGHEIFNIGYGEQVQLLDFVDCIEKEFGRKAIRNLEPKHPADVPETWSDTTKLKKYGYNPTTPITDGVHEFCNWYKSYYGVN